MTFVPTKGGHAREKSPSTARFALRVLCRLKPALLVLAAASVAWLGAAGRAAAEDADIEKLDKSVVRVVVVFQRDGQRLKGASTGTGFVIAPGYVATNNHVVAPSINGRPLPDDVEAQPLIPDGSWSKLRRAQIVWRSAELDLAVLRVPGLARDPLTLSIVSTQRQPKKGVSVIAIGYPAASDNVLRNRDAALVSSVTKGVVSKVVVAGIGGRTRPVIQHTADINPGNSGGPLFNACGHVIGVNTFGTRSRFQVVRDQSGNTVATGSAVSGNFFSPHIINLVRAVQNEPKLKSIRLTTTTSDCVPTAAGGIPVFVYVAVGVLALLAIAAIVIALRRGTTREIVRVVESYSAWVRRKGDNRSPSIPNIPRSADRSRPAASTPAAPDAQAAVNTELPPVGAASKAPKAPAAGGQVLRIAGVDSDGAPMRIEIALSALEEAAKTAEKGLIIGRSKTLSDHTLSDRSVSRRHARVALVGDRLMLEDLNSAYGTEIDGQALTAFQAMPVSPPARVRFGQVVLDVTLDKA